MPDRRSFLTTIGAAAAGLATSGGWMRAAAAGLPGATAGERRVSPIGIQLYTLRAIAAKDLAGTLAGVAQIGYTEVELAGLYGHRAAEVRALLDRNHLTAPSTHVDITAVQGDAAARTFADAHVLGHEWITVPSLPRGPLRTADDWKRVGGQLTRAAAATKAAGFRFAYHNHNTEFRPVGGETGYDILMRETDPDLVSYEMDLYWVVNAGKDPIAYIDRYAPRIRMFHVKDSLGDAAHTMADVGRGVIDFGKIFAEARAHDARIEHYFVEHDQPADPLASAKASFDHLSALEW